jgi:hypothetical protein
MLAAEDHLDGHEPVETDLPGLVDHAHTAAAKFFEQIEAGDLRQSQSNFTSRLSGLRSLVGIVSLRAW